MTGPRVCGRIRRPARRPPGRAAAVLTVAALAVALSGCSLPLGPGRDGTKGADTSASSASPSGSAASSPSGSAATSSAAADDPQDPARYATDVVRYAREAGVDAKLVLGILYNESYKPHDPEFERAWAEMDPDASLGVANMHQAAFDDTKRGRPFASRSWQELPDDPGLAIRAQAWYLHDLKRQLPAKRRTELTVDELLALGYNAGPGNMRSFARGVPPGSQAAGYLRDYRRNRTIAVDVLAGTAAG